MTAGPHPPNAAELLSSARLALLIKRLLADFDHVLIDSPPVLGLADAPLIASMVEGTVFVIRANGAGASVITSALERISSSAANVLGAVLTHYDSRQANYGYGYDYGYGYGRGGRRGATVEESRF
jgi:Mrp family chromosome partitioning ATPase